MRLMARKVMFLLAFLAAFGQAVAIAAFPRAAADEIGHAFAHVQEPSHHHHDDGLMHVDETQESTFHVHVGDGASVALVRPSKPAARSVAGLVLTLLVICYALAWMNPVASEQAQQIDEMARRIEAGEAWETPKAALPTGQAPGPGLEPKSCDAPGGGR